MFDTLQIAYNRLRKVSNLEGALKQLISPSCVRRALREVEHPSCLLERIALNQSYDPYVLLEEVASRLGLTALRDLDLPSMALIKRTGYDAHILREIPALPQYSKISPAGWTMLVADPSMISVDDYRKRGIDVQLAVKCDIENKWQEYQSLFSKSKEGEISLEQVFAIIEQLAKDADSNGAKEIFVGNPEPERYEYLIGENRYSGTIHPAVYKDLLAQFKNGTQFRRKIRSPSFSELTFALTKNLNNLVIYVSWEDSSRSMADVPAERDEEIVSDIELDSSVTVAERRKEEYSVTDSSAAKDSLAHCKRPKTNADCSAHLHVMLVDDDPLFAAILGNILERKGFQVSCHRDGQAALCYLDQNKPPPNVIICDVHMPCTDGVVFLKGLKERGGRIPILMLTSDEDESLEVELVELGATAFVRKREDVRVLLAWCNNLVVKTTSVNIDREKS